MEKLVKKNSPALTYKEALTKLIDYVTTDNVDDLPTIVLRSKQLVDKIGQIEWELQQWNEMLVHSDFTVSSQWAVDRLYEILKETSLKSSDDGATSDKADI
jgi:hypothetical protein|tara:strand:+ start:8510 stop:8812 length:303 start_codon:yes stop_codon:yes gene_type:complete